MRIRPTIIGFALALALSATAGYAVQEFTLDEARTRIERLEARVALLEAAIVADSRSATDASVVHTVTGAVVIESSQHFGLEGRGPYVVGDLCFGDAGLDDIRAGAAVRALDQFGNIVGLGRLSSGALTDAEPVRVCQFSWTMEVDDAAFYTFEVANRKGPSFSRAELEALNWTVALSI